MFMTGKDAFIRDLLESLGIPTQRLKSAAIHIDVDAAVSVDVTYLAEKPDDAVTRSFELHRPEALIGAMTELAGGKIRALELDQGDVIVYQCPDRLSMEAQHNIGEILAGEFGAEHRVLILDGGAELRIVKAPDQVLDTRSLDD